MSEQLGDGIQRSDLDECWCCGGLHDSRGLLCPDCDDWGCPYFGGECESDHKPVLPDGGNATSGTDHEDCTVSGCHEPAVRTLQWPEPGGLVAEFCDDHAEQKLSITAVTERSTDTGVDHPTEEADDE